MSAQLTSQELSLVNHVYNLCCVKANGAFGVEIPIPYNFWAREKRQNTYSGLNKQQEEEVDE